MAAGPGAAPVSPGAVLELAHALVADAAAAQGLRFLVLKGIGAQRLGLQVPRTSSDVDVLLPPEDAVVLGTELVHRGWRRRPVDVDEHVFPRHSDSYWHPAWSCDIDVHHRFPGIEADPRAAFDHMWDTRLHLPVAGTDVPTPDRAASTIVIALHGLRSPWVARHRQELTRLARTSALPPIDDVVAAAEGLGALACVRPFLEAAYGHERQDWGVPSAEWVLRTSFASPMARRIRVFLTASPARRAVLVRLALFPPRETLTKMNALRDLRGVRLAWAYVLRWSRGARSLPRALRAMHGDDGRVEL